MKADAAAIAAGHNDFTEYVLIEEDGITAHEMCRLGFGTIVPTVTAGPNGSFNFTVTLTSRNQGTTKWTGNMTTTTVTGTLVWTKDGKTYNYTFTAPLHAGHRELSRSAQWIIELLLLLVVTAAADGWLPDPPRPLFR